MTITYRYAREEMMTLRESVPSRTRPDNLSSEFNNDDGLFSPDRWIQHRWQCEGLANSSSVRKPAVNIRADNVANSAHDLEQTVLSPQRRGFTSGCRVPSPKFGVDEKAGKSSRWRHGHINGVDFKPSFQKNALESSTRRTTNNNNSSVWRNSNSVSDRHWNDKGRNNRGTYDNEKMPEWLEEGPSSMTDIIELKGFEDDISEKKTKKRKGKQSGTETGGRCRNSSAQGSRPSSRTHIESGCVVEELPPLRQDADGNFSAVEQKTGISDNNNSGAKNIDDVTNEMLTTTVLAKDKRHSLSEGVNTTTLSDETFHVFTDTSSTHVNSTVAVGVEPIVVKNNFPDTDAEFAAYLGIVDIDPSTMQKKDYHSEQPSTQLVSSRLSRFFANNSTSNTTLTSTLPPQSLQQPKHDSDGTATLDMNMASVLSKQQQQQHLLSQHSSIFDNQQQSQLFQHHQHHLINHRPIMGHSSGGMGMSQAVSAAQPLFADQPSANSGAGCGGTLNNILGLPPVLKQLFATAGVTSTAKRSAPSTTVATSPPASSTVEFNGAITVEELERRLASNMTLNGNNNKGADQGGNMNVFPHHHHSSIISQSVVQNAGGGGNGGDLIEALMANKQQPVHHHHASIAQQQLPMPPPPPFPPIAPATLGAAASIAAEMGPLPPFNADFVRSQFYVNAVAAGFNPLALFQAARLHQQQQQSMMMQQQQQNHLIRRLSPSNDLSSLPNAVIGKMLAHRAAQAAAVAAVASASSMSNSSSGESSHFQQRMQQQREQGVPSNYNAAVFASDQQQLNLAITRGDLATAQTIRARMIAQVQALAGVAPFQG